MTKYTTTSLIEELKKYPEDTPIKTDLAFIYHYNDMCDVFRNEMSDDEFLDFCKKTATDIAIFEGSWEDDILSDLNNIIPDYVDGWYKTKVTIDKKEYDELKKRPKIKKTSLKPKPNDKFTINNVNIYTQNDPEHIKDAFLGAVMEIQKKMR